MLRWHWGDLLQPVPILRNRGPESGLKSGGMPLRFALDGNPEVALLPVQVEFRGRVTCVGKTGHASRDPARALRSTSGR
jgi:hypothetical protein